MPVKFTDYNQRSFYQELLHNEFPNHAVNCKTLSTPRRRTNFWRTVYQFQ